MTQERVIAGRLISSDAMCLRLGDMSPARRQRRH